MTRLSRDFFARESDEVALDLLGAVLVHGEQRGRIVETEAYLGKHDLACHASRGRTKRTEVMFGEAGHAYVYLIYGMYDMLNIVTGPEGEAQAVLIRALEPLANIGANTSGPGRLCRALGITRALTGLDLCQEGSSLWLEAGAPPERIVTGPRIGIDYAGEWKDAPLRFFDPDSPWVSRQPAKPRPANN